MASRSKNKELARVRRIKKQLQAYYQNEARSQYLVENAGKEVKYSDRTYLITPNGSYRRLQTKEEIKANRKAK